MIAPQELRLGNWININGSPFQVELPDLNLIANKDGKSTYEPIELTEDWLFKFGFEKLNYTYWAKGLAVHNHDIVSFYMLYEQNRTYIKYVHQLQNLYFALTGEELKIKES